MTIFFKNTKYFNTHTWKEEDKLKLYSENFQILSNFPPPSPYPRKTKPNLANQLFIVLWLCINITIYFLLWVLLGIIRAICGFLSTSEALKEATFPVY